MSKPKTHYDALGVKPDADPAEIKRVFRSRAAQSHPDKGGEHGEMAELNLAYEVLIDPERRLLYDQTGRDSQQPIDERIRCAVLTAFQDALQQGAPNILQHAKQSVQTARETNVNGRAETERAIKRLRKLRSKIKTKDAVNCFHLIVDKQIEQMELQVRQGEDNIKTCDLVLEALAAYESSEPAPEQYVVRLGLGQMFSATTSGT